MEKIRDLFIPIQPTVKIMGKQVQYLELLPHTALRNYIYCYWVLKTDQLLVEDYVYRVVADGCIDVFFEQNNPEESFVMGFCKKYTEFDLGTEFCYIGIRFLPTMFPQLFKVDAQGLSNQFQSLDQVVPALATYISEVFTPEVSGPREIQSLCDQFFLSWINELILDTDDRFYNALDTILKKHGVLQIEKDLNTGLSPRQLRRKFNYYLGTSPKTFGKVVRFQNILRAKPSTQSLRQNKLFYTGYYDQAHFIKDFKSLYGVSPTQAFNRQ